MSPFLQWYSLILIFLVSLLFIYPNNNYLMTFVILITMVTYILKIPNMFFFAQEPKKCLNS